MDVSHSALTGRFVRLEPLAPAHLPGLYAAIAHPQVFEFGFGGGPIRLPRTIEEFEGWAAGYLNPERGYRYAVVVIGGPHDGEVVGTTTLGDFEEQREAAHLGWTAYDPRVWSTAVNPEAKLLLLGHAFDSGVGRVKIQTDVINQRSRAAIAALGARFEGVVRRDLRRPDGTWRDSAVFSIIVDEWPAVRDGLVARLARFAGPPVLFRSPSEQAASSL